MTTIITYSPAYTIVPTYECFNRCSYCNFRVEPNHDRWITLDQGKIILEKLKPLGVSEILILAGEVHPQSSRRNDWFQLIYDLGKLAQDMGFFPHTNAGILTFAEMEKLAKVNISMGLMLEQITPKLLTTVHRYSPSKIPKIRLRQLEWAGLLEIPFTTGLLLGLGENQADRIDTLKAIARVHQKYGHIQEVILQPYRSGSQDTFNNCNFDIEELPKLVQLAREILPTEITIQIPPNLVSLEILLACLIAGATDLGGISPKDEVNPNYTHLSLIELTKILKDNSYKLQERLPIYPAFTNKFKQKNFLHYSTSFPFG